MSVTKKSGNFFSLSFIENVVKIIVLNLVTLYTVFAQSNAVIRKWGDWQSWGDQKNGTYLNPILPADFSDLDCIRVDDDYYAISSTFQYSPGVIILHSKDLVNWTIASHAVDNITAISTELNWDKMNRYGRGVWAGAIRFHDNKFWICFGDPDSGYFMTTAKQAEGPWEPITNILPEKGWDDCCPFWDDDGQGYLVGTNFADAYKIHLFKLSENGKEIIKASDKVIHQSKGSEANKLYKFNGTYYHLFSEVKPGGRCVMMERSKNIYGPYSEVKQLSHAQKEFNEPNQGGIVQTQKGDWYFLTHHGVGDWSGRVMSLLPVTWVDDWPVIGEPGTDKIGSMVWSGKMPLKSVKANLRTSDEFSNAMLSPQWEWNYQPRDDKWSLTERKGFLRLYAMKPLQENNLLKAANTITERTIRTVYNEVVVKLDINGMADGQKAGLSHFGSPNYSTIGVTLEGTTKMLEFSAKGVITKGPVITGNHLWLKSTWQLDGQSQYYYSLDGKSFIPFGNLYQMTWGSYRGDRIAIYNYNNKENAGYIDVDFFHYTYTR